MSSIKYKFTINNFNNYDKVVMVTPNGVETVVTSSSGETACKKIGFYVYKGNKKSLTKWFDCKGDALNSYTSISFSYNGTVHSYEVDTESLISGEYTFKTLKGLINFGLDSYTSNSKEYTFDHWSITESGDEVVDDTIITKASTFYAVFKEVKKASSMCNVIIGFYSQSGNYYEIFSGEVKSGTTIEDLFQSNYKTINFANNESYGPNFSSFANLTSSEFELFKKGNGTSDVTYVGNDYVISKDSYLFPTSNSSEGKITIDFVLDTYRVDSLDEMNVYYSKGDKILDDALSSSIDVLNESKTNLTDFASYSGKYAYTYDGNIYSDSRAASTISSDSIAYYDRTIAVGMYASGLSGYSLNKSSTVTQASIKSVVEASEPYAPYKTKGSSRPTYPTLFFSLINSKYKTSLEGTVKDTAGVTWTIKCLNDTMYYAIGDSALTNSNVNSTYLKSVVDKVKELGSPYSTCDSFTTSKGITTSYSLKGFSFEYGKCTMPGLNGTTVDVSSSTTFILYSWFGNDSICQ